MVDRRLAQRFRVPSLSFALALGATALVAPEILAGELKIGAKPLETDEQGNITAAGKAAAVKEVASVPGEEEWPIHVWAKIDKGAPGPLYVEFYGTLPGTGKRYKAWYNEHRAYEGEKYVSLEIELDGNNGFNRGKTYAVEVVQIDDKGKSLKLASGELTLTYTEAPKDEDEDEDDGEDDEDEDDEDEGGDDLSEQDVLDSFAGGDGGGGGDGAPPEVTPPGKKKGCHVDPGAGAAPGVLVLLMLGAGLTRRRRG